MPVFSLYRGTADLRDAIQAWSLSELPAGKPELHCVEVAHYRFQITLSTENAALKVHVAEVPWRQMTLRQLSNAIWRLLCASVGSRACRASALRQDIAAGLDGTVPPRLAYQDGKWWSVTSRCESWQQGLRQYVDHINKAPSPVDIGSLPQPVAMTVDREALEPVCEQIQALIAKDRSEWNCGQRGVQWCDIERILLMLYCIPAAQNSEDVVALRDRMFRELFDRASDCLGLTLGVADRLTAAMDGLPFQETLNRAVLEATLPLCWAAAELVRRSLPHYEGGQNEPQIDPSLLARAGTTLTADREADWSSPTTRLFALSSRMLRWREMDGSGEHGPQAVTLVRSLVSIADDAIWDEAHRTSLLVVFRQMVARVSEELVAASGAKVAPRRPPRRWGPPAPDATVAKEVKPPADVLLAPEAG